MRTVPAGRRAPRGRAPSAFIVTSTTSPTSPSRSAGRDRHVGSGVQESADADHPPHAETMGARARRHGRKIGGGVGGVHNPERRRVDTPARAKMAPNSAPKAHAEAKGEKQPATAT